MKNFRTATERGGNKQSDYKVQDQSTVSVVQMGDSMQMDEPKGLAARQNPKPVNEEFNNPNNDSKLTGNFDPNQSHSGNHYMDPMASSQRNLVAEIDGMS